VSKVTYPLSQKHSTVSIPTLFVTLVTYVCGI